MDSFGSIGSRLSEPVDESESTMKSTVGTGDSSLESINGPVLNNSSVHSIKPKKHSNEISIPELENFEKEVVEKFLRKFGSFSKPSSLTNKERKKLKKLSLLKENKKLAKKKYRSKRNRPEKKMSESKCKQRIAFDLSYFNENLMRHVDMRMCVKQIHRCYSENRKLTNPVQFHITSIKEKAEEILSHNAGYKNWDVKFHEASYLEAFKKEEVIYLTSESENVIDSLDDSKVYVIGGLLDHNSLKGLSYNRAVANNISHGRLPIDKYINMKTLKVLPINQVYSVLASVANGKSWSDALINTIPQRKEATTKTANSKISSNSS